MSRTPEDILRQLRAYPAATTPAAPGNGHEVDHPAVEQPDDGCPTTELASVDGASLLEDVERFAGRFVALPSEHCLVVLVLWIAHTWAVPAFYVTPRLVLDSPEPGTGKTRVLEVLTLLCRAAKMTLSTTTAALYRRIEAAGDHPPTILQDEVDAIFGRTSTPQTEDLRALFNAGYKRGATVDRCEGDAKNMKVREFKVFAAVGMAGLAGRLPATITDRAVTIHMRRRSPDEQLAEFRERDAKAEAEPLRRQLEAWADANLDALTAARPAMPDGVRDRPAEVWEALLAVADNAGGEWPDRARAACAHFVLDRDPDELSLGVRLLRDVREAFGGRDRMFTTDLLASLTTGEESEWADLYGKPLDQRRLAKELKRYGIRAKMIRIGDEQTRGYRVDGDEGLGQAWDRYLPSISSRISRTGGTDARQIRLDVYPICTSRTQRVPDENRLELGLFSDGTAGTRGTHTNGSPSPNSHQAGPARCGVCGIPLERPESMVRELCAECAFVANNKPAVTESAEERK